MEFSFEAEDGLTELLVTRSTNADTVVPAFVVGTTDPLVITSTRIDQSQLAMVEIRATTLLGDVTLYNVTFNESGFSDLEGTLTAQQPGQVPEPASLALLAGSFFGCAALRKKARRAAATAWK